MCSRSWFIIGLIFLTILPVSAQSESHPPQFLFRDGDRLVLVNGETGEAAELPHITATSSDYFEWSPDGKYLVVLLSSSVPYLKCLNVYDVEMQEWLFDNPIACNVIDAKISHDATYFAYATQEEYEGALWLYTRANGEIEQLFITSGGDEILRNAIGVIDWSPNDQYLAFEHRDGAFGGSFNSLIVMHLESREFYSIVGARFGYYASYRPIWSPDDEWFLLVLQEEYVTSGMFPVTNHRGDLYLIRSHTGEQYRLTYTPTDEESNIRWLPNGAIAYDTVLHTTLSIEEAINIVEPPLESIITPEPLEPPERAFSSSYPAPNEGLFAWVVQSRSREEGSSTHLNIGVQPLSPENTVFTASLPEDYQFTNVIIGWRP